MKKIMVLLYVDSVLAKVAGLSVAAAVATFLRIPFSATSEVWVLLAVLLPITLVIVSFLWEAVAIALQGKDTLKSVKLKFREWEETQEDHRSMIFHFFLATLAVGVVGGPLDALAVFFASAVIAAREDIRAVRAFAVVLPFLAQNNRSARL